jgi:hypothetical protein
MKRIIENSNFSNFNTFVFFYITFIQKRKIKTYNPNLGKTCFSVLYNPIAWLFGLVSQEVKLRKYFLFNYELLGLVDWSVKNFFFNLMQQSIIANT